MGKTAFALNLCTNNAKGESEFSEEKPSIIFSLEMKNRLLALRMLSAIGHIDGQKIRNPMANFTADDWKRNTHALGQLATLPLHLFDKSGVTIPYIRRKLRRLKRRYPTQHLVVMVDYLQLIHGDPAYKGNRTQEISQISRDLKGIARELDLTVIALSQLSREVENRPDKRPTSRDLRESGQIEQDADVIMFMYRDDYYDKESESKGISEIILTKQRNGPTGTVELNFIKEYSKFTDINYGNGQAPH
jgi:replicative DNA helicase